MNVSLILNPQHPRPHHQGHTHHLSLDPLSRAQSRMYRVTKRQKQEAHAPPPHSRRETTQPHRNARPHTALLQGRRKRTDHHPSSPSSSSRRRAPPCRLGLCAKTRQTRRMQRSVLAKAVLFKVDLLTSMLSVSLIPPG